GPSHSQITKDHANSPFFGLAFRLAAAAIRRIRDRMLAVWGQDAAFDFASFPPNAPRGASEEDAAIYRQAQALYREGYEITDDEGRVRGRSVEARESRRAA